MDFLLNLLPNWAIVSVFLLTTIILIGSEVVKTLPFIGKYGYFIMPIGIVIIVLCVHIWTTKSVNQSWELKITELEHKMEILSYKSDKVNEKIVREYIEVPIEKIITRNKILKESVPVLIPFEKDCNIPKEAIDLYNKSLSPTQIVHE